MFYAAKLEVKNEVNFFFHTVLYVQCVSSSPFSLFHISHSPFGPGPFFRLYLLFLSLFFILQFNCFHLLSVFHVCLYFYSLAVPYVFNFFSLCVFFDILNILPPLAPTYKSFSRCHRTLYSTSVFSVC